MTKIGIFYFTGTGNTAQVVKELEKELTGLGLEAKSFNIRDPHPDHNEFDVVGIAYPVYAWAPPWSIVNWAKNRKWRNNQPVFLFQNFAGDPANSIRKALIVLKKTGVKVFSFGECLMMESWTTVRTKTALEKMEPWFEEHKNDFGSAGEYAKKLASEIKEGKFEPAIMPKYRFTWWNAISPFYSKQMLSISYRNKLNISKCTKCGLCAKICPTNSVKLMPYPIFKYPCAGCFGCVNLCQLTPLTLCSQKAK